MQTRRSSVVELGKEVNFTYKLFVRFKGISFAPFFILGTNICGFRRKYGSGQLKSPRKKFWWYSVFIRSHCSVVGEDEPGLKVLFRIIISPRYLFVTF